MNPTLGLLLDASFYLMAWLTFDRPGKGCEGDELGLVWNRSGEHIASQTASGSHKGYSQQCGIWAPSEGVTTGNEGLYSLVQGNSLFLFKLEIGGKNLPCKFKAFAIQGKAGKEQMLNQPGDTAAVCSD